MGESRDLPKMFNFRIIYSFMYLLIQGSNLGPKNKVLTIGTAILNLAEYAYAADGEACELSIPVVLSGTAAERHPSLCVSTITCVFYTCLFFLILYNYNFYA